MMIVTRGGHATEYLPDRVGFGQSEVRDGALYRNGKAIDIKAAAYNAAADAKTTEADIKKLQQGGVNTIWVDYPQPVWFYDICDRAGMYVIDQANVNSSHETSNRALGGALSNAPAWLPTFMERTQAMYERAKNHVSIVGWSLGGRQGNGYNMYRTYQWLKGAEPHRAVIYNDSAGEWNSDLPSVEVKR